MNHSTKFTSDHDWFIKSFQKIINVNPSGIISPTGIEHIILSYDIIGYASMIGDYNCKGLGQYIDFLNPHQLRNEVIATSAVTFALVFMYFSRTIPGQFTESLLMAIAKKKIPVNIQNQIETTTEIGLNSISKGGYSKIKNIHNWIDNMKNSGLQKILKVGLVVGGIAGVAGYMSPAN